MTTQEAFTPTVEGESGETHVPDWWVNRIISAVSLLTSGLMLDWHWYGCAFAWAIVAGGFLLWSISAHEMRR